MAAREMLLNFLKTRGGLTALMTTGATGSYVLYNDKERFPRMVSYFTHGNILPPLSEHLHEVTYFPRPGLEKQLRNVMGPTFSNEYYVVKGEVGSGKTRLFVELVRQMQEASAGRGAPVYVSCIQGKSLSDALAKAVGFHFDEHINFRYFLDVIFRVHSFPSRDEEHKLTRTLEAIEIAAFQYMEKTGQPAVLIIDSANNLAANSPKCLAKLEEKAKLWADTNIAKVIFVCNDERTQVELQRHHDAWSRAATPIHIGDLSKEDAARYLMSQEFMETHTIPEIPMTLEHALLVVHLIGSRIHHLILYKHKYVRGQDHNKIIQDMMAKEREKFLSISKKPSQWQVLEILLKTSNHTVPLSYFANKGFLEDVHELAQENLLVLERHKKGFMVKFESKLVETVVTEFAK